MKLAQAMLGLLLSVPVYSAALNYPCRGAAGTYRTNPDNTPGGFVAATATVDATAFLGVESSVCDHSSVLEGARVLDRAEISGRAIVRGKVEVSGKSRVYGQAYLINANGEALSVTDQAKIYGNAYLQGSVKVAGTSQVFGWGRVYDYAQVLGNSRVCETFSIGEFDILVDDFNSMCRSKGNN